VESVDCFQELPKLKEVFGCYDVKSIIYLTLAEHSYYFFQNYQEDMN